MITNYKYHTEQNSNMFMYITSDIFNLKTAYDSFLMFRKNENISLY